MAPEEGAFAAELSASLGKHSSQMAAPAVGCMQHLHALCDSAEEPSGTSLGDSLNQSVHWR